MSTLTDPTQIFLFASFLYHEAQHQAATLQNVWQDKYGPGIWLSNPDCPKMKGYYAKEMGEQASLARFLIVSERPYARSELVPAKLWADAWEREYSVAGKRSCNLDVGWVALEQVVLATGKPYSHRLHFDSGVYGELTYCFENNSYRQLPWTYPDYTEAAMIQFFNQARQKLHVCLKNQAIQG